MRQCSLLWAEDGDAISGALARERQVTAVVIYRLPADCATPVEGRQSEQCIDHQTAEHNILTARWHFLPNGHRVSGQQRVLCMCASTHLDCTDC